MRRKGQTALEYMLMVVVVLSLLVLVITMTAYVSGAGAAVGGVIGETRTQVLAWLMT